MIVKTHEGSLQHPIRYRVFALLVGFACHSIFLSAVALMGLGIYSGLASGHGTFTGYAGLLFNLALVVQFPLLHSWLLTSSGRSRLLALSPKAIARDMTTTWFALIASAQLLLLFLFWSPSGVMLYEFQGPLRWLSVALYGASWLFLLRTMYDADMTLQSGLKGWLSVAKNTHPSYSDFPQACTFRICRQPIYLAFALILWTAPVWTLDRLLLVMFWTVYCVYGPRFKEARCIQYYGDRFRAYQERVPYFFPVRSPLKVRTTSVPRELR